MQAALATALSQSRHILVVRNPMLNRVLQTGQGQELKGRGPQEATCQRSTGLYAHIYG